MSIKASHARWSPVGPIGTSEAPRHGGRHQCPEPIQQPSMGRVTDGLASRVCPGTQFQTDHGQEPRYPLDREPRREPTLDAAHLGRRNPRSPPHCCLAQAMLSSSPLEFRTQVDGDPPSTLGSCVGPPLPASHSRSVARIDLLRLIRLSALRSNARRKRTAPGVPISRSVDLSVGVVHLRHRRTIDSPARRQPCPGCTQPTDGPEVAARRARFRAWSGRFRPSGLRKVRSMHRRAELDAPGRRSNVSTSAMCVPRKRNRQSRR
jgi:hypothetical protein